MNKITTVQQLRKHLEQLFPKGTSGNSIMEWLKKNNFEYSDLEEGKIYASRVSKKFFLITTKWLIVFYFDDCYTLGKITTEEGYIGL